MCIVPESWCIWHRLSDSLTLQVTCQGLRNGALPCRGGSTRRRSRTSTTGRERRESERWIDIFTSSHLPEVATHPLSRIPVVELDQDLNQHGELPQATISGFWCWWCSADVKIVKVVTTGIFNGTIPNGFLCKVRVASRASCQIISHLLKSCQTRVKTDGHIMWSRDLRQNKQNRGLAASIHLCCWRSPLPGLSWWLAMVVLPTKGFRTKTWKQRSE